MIDIHRTTESGEEKRQCLAALGKAKDETLLREALDFILDSGEVRESHTENTRAQSTLTSTDEYHSCPSTVAIARARYARPYSLETFLSIVNGKIQRPCR